VGGFREAGARSVVRLRVKIAGALQTIAYRDGRDFKPTNQPTKGKTQ
jgi:hypothetical protein